VILRWLVGAVGIELLVALKTRMLLILCKRKTAQNTKYAEPGYTPGTRSLSIPRALTMNAGPTGTMSRSTSLSGVVKWGQGLEPIRIPIRSDARHRSRTSLRLPILYHCLREEPYRSRSVPLH